MFLHFLFANVLKQLGELSEFVRSVALNIYGLQLTMHSLLEYMQWDVNF